VAPSGAITATSNNFSALIGFYDPSAGWCEALYSYTPTLVSYAQGGSSFTATISNLPFASLATAAANDSTLQADLTASIQATVAAGGVSGLTADLTAAPGFGMLARGNGSAQSALTTGIALACLAGGRSYGGDSLTTGIALVSRPTGASNASGAVITGIRLATAMSGAGAISGTPTTGIRIASSAGGRSQIGAPLLTDFNLHASSAGSGSAVSSIIVPKPLTAQIGGNSSMLVATIRTGVTFKARARGAGSFQGTAFPQGAALAAMISGNSIFDPPLTTLERYHLPILLSHQIPGIYQPGPLPEGQFPMGPGEVSVYAIDWTYWLAFLWQPGYSAALGYVIRPFPWTGYEYICTTAGQTGNYAPVWPDNAVGEMVVDGSVVWTSQALSVASLQTSVVSASYSAPLGIVTTGYVIVNNLTPVQIDATTATPGKTYEVMCTAALASGDFLIGKLIFDVN
jgi:hypothetical protein